MDRATIRAARRYEASVDRLGLALGTGGALAGIVVLLLTLLGGQRDPAALAAAWLIGSLLSALGIAAIAGPLWLVLHIAGLRRMRYAVASGAVMTMALFVGAQTYGFGMFDMPAMDSRTFTFRWLSALSTSAILAGIAAVIAAIMWRIAYRVSYEL